MVSITREAYPAISEESVKQADVRACEPAKAVRAQ
jgi:hypothetical protein